MKKSFWILLVITCTCFAYCSPRIQHTTDETSMAIDFIKQAMAEKMSGKEFILSGKPRNMEEFTCLENLMEDTAGFSAAERRQIRKQVSHPGITAWTGDMFPQARILNADTIKAAFMERDKSWPYFHKQYGKSYYQVSVPIFLRNNTLCLFYTDYNCGPLCGQGAWVLYKKTGDKWESIKTFCRWIS
ncbi:hypothetical protein [Sediminibacterium ginsengisoli]|uniref:Uncharacterized protein n=1 Tax=Sediminibacterium ginsengisoli TaxID=413434 RepID=A0A1T4RFJ9_9BACT|nr:hypothetical protein [Sediminibacterium ginsengisoli]SKA14755.1 hypothetical protein SAMN04488132_11221 [Sediminibacterium ginsengisoli]